MISHRLRLEENSLGNNFAVECVPIRGFWISLQVQTFGVEIMKFGIGDRPGSHESERILRQSCSLGYFLQA